MSARNPPSKRADQEVEIFCHHTMAGHSHVESDNRPVQIGIEEYFQSCFNPCIP